MPDCCNSIGVNARASQSGSGQGSGGGSFVARPEMVLKHVRVDEVQNRRAAIVKNVNC